MLFRRTSSKAPSRRPVAGRPIEALEDRRLMTVTGLTLFNAVDDVAYGPLNDGDQVSHVQRNTWGFTLKAETAGTVGSVKWTLDGNPVAGENFAPFAIGGDDGGDLRPFALGQGAHAVTATAYSGRDGTGAELGTVTRSFTVIDNADGTAAATAAGLTGLTLMNAVDDVAYGALNEGATVSFVQLNTWGITLRADTSGPVGSVLWSYDDNANYLLNNAAPFAIAGANGADLTPWSPPSLGTHTVKVTAYSGPDGSGTVLNSMTRTFTVADQPFPTTPQVTGGAALSINDVSTNEGNSGTKTLAFTVTRGGSTSASSTVNWSTQNNSAGEGDYQVASGSLSFAPGQTSKSINITIKGDTRVEGNEVFFVNLSGATGASISDGRGAGTIVNDDATTTPTPTPTPTRSVTDISWSRSGPRAPEPKTEAGVVQVGSKIYSVGGFTGRGGSGSFFPLTRRVYAYDMATRQYKELAPLPSQAAGNHFGLASDGQNIYAVAGQLEATYGKGTSTAWKYNIATNKWTQFTSLPQIRFGGTAFVHNGWLHFVGGDKADRTSVSTDHWSINLSNPSSGWQRRASIPLGGDHMSHASINGKHYLFGGEHSHKGLYGSGGGGYIQHNYTFEYNPATDTWARKANMPLALSHIEGSTLVINGKAVLIGGLLDGGEENTTNRVHVYDPVANSWKTLSTRYPKRVIGAMSGYWNGKIYMSEGYSPDEGDRQVGFEGTVKFG